MNRLRDERGFTLPEMLVAAMLMVIVMSATLSVLDQVTRLGKTANDRVDMQDRARQTGRELSRALRNIAPSPEFPAVIERSGAYDLVFRSVDRPRASGSNTRNLRRVRYCLDASDPDRARLLEQTQRWTTTTAPALPASTACPSTSWSSSRVVGDYITNRSGGTDRALWTYGRTDSGLITAVTVNLHLNANPANSAEESSLETGVYLRNQNRAPTALFTGAAVGTSHVLLNGSTSSDPEGDPLTYFWFVNGAEVGRGLIFDYAAPAGGTYEVRLDVRDASGLLGRSPTQTVVLP
ncbi:MAG TPA: PKD domain-containing protein [Thermoleophilaceae bacterium]|nr:PKD domain-containing protein [Thermoleophilaceae bacterium]